MYVHTFHNTLSCSQQNYSRQQENEHLETWEDIMVDMFIAVVTGKRHSYYLLCCHSRNIQYFHNFLLPSLPSGRYGRRGRRTTYILPLPMPSFDTRQASKAAWEQTHPNTGSYPNSKIGPAPTPPDRLRAPQPPHTVFCVLVPLQPLPPSKQVLFLLHLVLALSKTKHCKMKTSVLHQWM